MGFRYVMLYFRNINLVFGNLMEISDISRLDWLVIILFLVTVAVTLMTTHQVTQLFCPQKISR